MRFGSIVLLLSLLSSCAAHKHLERSQATPVAEQSSATADVARVQNTPYIPKFKDAPPASRAWLSKASRYFLEIALGSEYGLGDFTVKKWVDDIRIELIGHPTEADRQTVQAVLADINDLIGLQVKIHQVSENGNVKVHFIPHSEFYQFEPNGIVFYGGFFWSWWNYAGEIFRARVVIGSDRIEQIHRDHLIREELTQILGLMNDSNRYQSSIFYQGHSLTQEFSEMDKTIIRLLYNEGISAGMTDYQVKSIISGKENLGVATPASATSPATK